MEENNKTKAAKGTNFIQKIKNALQGIPKSFVLFGRALKSSKKDFWISIQVLFWISLALSILFYFVEHSAQPNEYRTWWDAFVWTVSRYIGDPGHFASADPVTIVGRHIESFIGILNILIFAVPAGLVANGYVKAMEDERKENHLRECREKIVKSFKRVRNPETKYRVVPRNVSLMSLAVKKNMTEADIIDTVSEYDEFRLRNLADTQSKSEHAQDRLVIEMMPLNEETVDGYKIIRTTYGIKINRGSNITIVTPTADIKNSIGHIGYYLAQFGGFNYVSRLFVTDVDDRVSYITAKLKEKDTWEPPLRNFVDDISHISNSKDNWNIVLLSTMEAPEAQVHFAHKNKNRKSITTLDETPLLELFDTLSQTLQNNYGLISAMDHKNFIPIGNNNISVTVGGGTTNNAFILRLSYSLITWTEHWTPVIVDMARIIKMKLEKPLLKQLAEKKEWKKTGVGYGNGEIQHKQTTAD